MDFHVSGNFAGGGRDLATAVSFGKQSTINNSTVSNNQTNIATVKPFELTANPIAVANNQAQPTLKHLIPAESILKPFLPKVNTASTRVHPPSTTTNITAASNAAMSYSNAAGYGGAIKTPATNPQGKYNRLIFDHFLALDLLVLITMVCLSAFLKGNSSIKFCID